MKNKKKKNIITLMKFPIIEKIPHIIIAAITGIIHPKNKLVNVVVDENEIGISILGM